LSERHPAAGHLEGQPVASKSSASVVNNGSCVLRFLRRLLPPLSLFAAFLIISATYRRASRVTSVYHGRVGTGAAAAAALPPLTGLEEQTDDALERDVFSASSAAAAAAFLFICGRLAPRLDDAALAGAGAGSCRCLAALLLSCGFLAALALLSLRRFGFFHLDVGLQRRASQTRWQVRPLWQCCGGV